MEITLEKIELVKDRTGVTYKEAKEALEEAEGSVVDAIINLEEAMEDDSHKSFGTKGAAVVDSVKELVKKGNVSRIVVKKADEDTLVNIPVNAGILGVVIAPWGMLAGAVAAFGFKCIIEIVKTDGTIIDVSDRTNDAMHKAREKGADLADAAKEKSADVYEKVKTSDVFERVKTSESANKVKEAAETAKQKTQDAFNKTQDVLKKKREEASEEFADAFEDLEEEAEDAAAKVKEAAGEVKEEVKSDMDDIKEKMEDVAEKIEEAVKEGK